MKKLNKKGFTLIELLAVIVILAVVMVVTIPSVLSSMSSAKETQARNAISTIELYIQQQYDKCIVGDKTLTGNYDSDVLNTSSTSKCDPKTTAITDLAKAGYLSKDIVSVTGTFTNGKYKVTSSVLGKDGKFSGVTGSVDGVTFTQST